MQDAELSAIASLNRADVAPEIRAALTVLGHRHTTFPSILLTDSLQALSYPYPAPMQGSWLSFQSAFMFVEANQPIDANINAGVTGNGTAIGALPAGIEGGVFFASKVSSAIGDNEASSDWSVQLNGFFVDGEPYELPSFQVEFSSGANTKGDAIIIVTEETQAGPALCTARLRRATYPNTDLQNGSANMTDPNGNRLTLTVAGAPATQRTTLQIGTKVTDIYAVLMEIILASMFADVSNKASVARISAVAPKTALAAVRNLRSL